MPASGYTELNQGLKSGWLEPVTEGITNVWPNPTRTEFTFFNGSGYPVDLRILDAAGRMVGSFKNIGCEETVRFGGGYQTGTYLVEALGDGVQKVFKVIKQ